MELYSPVEVFPFGFGISKPVACDPESPILLLVLEGLWPESGESKQCPELIELYLRYVHLKRHWL